MLDRRALNERRPVGPAGQAPTPERSGAGRGLLKRKKRSPRRSSALLPRWTLTQDSLPVVSATIPAREATLGHYQPQVALTASAAFLQAAASPSLPAGVAAAFFQASAAVVSAFLLVSRMVSGSFSSMHLP